MPEPVVLTVAEETLIEVMVFVTNELEQERYPWHSYAAIPERRELLNRLQAFHNEREEQRTRGR